ncbi:hypothetical protein PspLS_02293, partial [Pyricularia sp. CBS 133598]
QRHKSAKEAPHRSQGSLSCPPRFSPLHALQQTSAVCHRATSSTEA